MKRTTPYVTPNGRRYGDPAKWFIFKGWTGHWIVSPPSRPYWAHPPQTRPPTRYEPTYEAARNYLIQQLDKAQLT